MLKYSDLTPLQKKFICNGCGGKGGFINPPEFIFHDSCNQHDFYYWRGCNNSHRLIADKSFYKFMKKAILIANVKWYKKSYYHVWAYAYYRSVRLIGSKFFHYGFDMKNIVNLELEMKR